MASIGLSSGYSCDVQGSLQNIKGFSWVFTAQFMIIQGFLKKLNNVRRDSNFSTVRKVPGIADDDPCKTWEALPLIATCLTYDATHCNVANAMQCDAVRCDAMQITYA